MVSTLRNRSAVSLIFLAILLTPAISLAAPALDDWRVNITGTRMLAENNLPLAYKEVQRLQAELPADATPADQARLLNLFGRIEAYMALTAQAETHARLALEIAEKNADKVGQVEALLNLTLTSINQAKLDQLVNATTRSVTLLDGVDRPELLGEAMTYLAMTYLRIGNLEESVSVAMQALEIAKHNNNSVALAYAHWGLSIQFSQSGNQAQAYEHNAQMRVQAQAARSGILEAQALSGMATAQKYLGDMAEAERLLHESIALLRKIGAPFSLNHSLFARAQLFRSQERHAEAIPLFDEVIANYGKYPNPIGLWYALMTRSTSLQALGRLAGARADVAKAYTLSKEIGQSNFIGESARRMAALAAAAGDHQRAYAFLVEADKIISNTTQKNSGTRILELTQRYESDSAKHQLDELSRSNEQQRIRQYWLWSVLGAVLALLIISVYLLRRLRLANRKLSASSSQLEMMDFALKNMHEATYIADMDFRILYVNEEACRALGYSKEELLGMTLFDIDPFFRENIESVLAGAKMNTKGIYVHEQRHRTKDGRIFPVEIRASSFEYQGKRLNISLARDISESKCMQAALQESEARYRSNSNLLQSILESPSKVGIYALDREYRYLSFNSSFSEGAKRLWGADIAIGMSMLDEAINDEAHRAFCKQGFDHVLAGNSFDVESREARVKDGETTYEYHANYGSPIFDENGEVIGLTIFVTNITARKRMEEALLASEKQFRSLAENSPDLIFRYDRNCRRLYVNPAVISLSGKSTNELLGRSPDDRALLVAEENEKLMKVIRRAFNSGEIVSHAVDRLVLGGKHHNYEMQIIPERDESGEIATVLAIAHDITVIRDAEQRMARFAANVPGCVNTYLLHADGKGSFPFASPGIFDIFGLQPEEVAQSAAPMIALIHPDDRILVNETAIKSRQTMLPCSRQYRINHPSKGERWLESFQAPELTGEGLVQWHGMTFDITERKQAETLLHESRMQLQGLVAHREAVREEERKYIAREVHDGLGQILTGIQLSLSMIQQNYATAAPSLGEDLRTPMNWVDQAIAAVRSISYTLRPVELDLGFLPALEWQIDRFTKFTQVGCELHLNEEDIQLDDAQSVVLFRVIQESLTNISRHAHAGQVLISLTRERDDYVLKIRDNGTGFDVNAKKTGSFGLIGIRERIILLGGTVSIVSQNENGTEIVVHIPVRKNND